MKIKAFVSAATASLLALPCFASVTSPQTGDAVDLKIIVPICLAALVALIIILIFTKNKR